MCLRSSQLEQKDWIGLAWLVGRELESQIHFSLKRIKRRVNKVGHFDFKRWKRKNRKEKGVPFCAKVYS